MKYFVNFSDFKIAKRFKKPPLVRVTLLAVALIDLLRTNFRSFEMLELYLNLPA